MDGMPHAARRNEARRRPGPKRPKGQPVGPEEVRAAVLEAGGRLFARYGVEAVTIRDIATEADVHHGLIGRYIGKRDVLVEEVYRHLTHQLVSEISGGPLRPRSFERDSVMGAWTVLLTYYAVRQEMPADDPVNPVRALADAIEQHYGADSATARWRAAQIVGSAVGWRLYEPLLAQMGSLDPDDLPAIRLDLNLLHNIVGSLGLPTVDPRPPAER
jgi:AcrR family transcriptional regulator